MHRTYLITNCCLLARYMLRGHTSARNSLRSSFASSFSKHCWAHTFQHCQVTRNSWAHSLLLPRSGGEERSAREEHRNMGAGRNSSSPHSWTQMNKAYRCVVNRENTKREACVEARGERARRARLARQRESVVQPLFPGGGCQSERERERLG